MDIKNQKNRVDPIGLEMVLAVLSLGVSSVAALHQFGLLPKRESKSVKAFKKLRRSVLHVQNQLDDLILTFQRHASYSEVEKKNSPMTLTGTLMRLKERDYFRWNTVRSTLNELANEVAEVVRALRSMEADLEEPLPEFGDEAILSLFDRLFLNMGSSTVSEFVDELRKALSALVDSLGHVIESRRSSLH